MKIMVFAKGDNLDTKLNLIVMELEVALRIIRQRSMVNKVIDFIKFLDNFVAIHTPSFLAEN